MKSKIVLFILILVAMLTLCSCKIRVKNKNYQPNNSASTEKEEDSSSEDTSNIETETSDSQVTDEEQNLEEVVNDSSETNSNSNISNKDDSSSKEDAKDEKDKFFEFGDLTENPTTRPDQYDSTEKEALELTMDIVYQRNSDISQEMYNRSVLREGNNARLKKVIEKAKAGETVKIGVLGGSITGGAAASSWDKAYGKNLVNWWAAQFPKCDVEYYNAGIGSTGSIIAAHRAYDDLLVNEPDLVVVDFSVNDSGTATDKEAYESVIRQVLKSEKAPAVIIISFMSEGGHNYQDMHLEIAEHYDLPMISFRDALWPEMEDGTYNWDEFYPDYIHPNNRGHKMAADLIVHYIAKVYLDTTTDVASAIPTALSKNRFEVAKIYNNSTIEPVTNTGWQAGNNLYEAYNPLLPMAFKKGWRATENGAEIAFNIEDARSFSIVYKRMTEQDKAGSVDIYVNEQKVKTLSSYYGAEYACAEQLVLEDTKEDYTVRLVFKGTGNQRFDLLGIMVAN